MSAFSNVYPGVWIFFLVAITVKAFNNKQRVLCTAGSVSILTFMSVCVQPLYLDLCDNCADSKRNAAMCIAAPIGSLTAGILAGLVVDQKPELRRVLVWIIIIQGCNIMLKLLYRYDLLVRYLA